MWGSALMVRPPWCIIYLGGGSMATWINAKSIAYKLVDIFADNRVMPSEWKYQIPLFIVQQPQQVVWNARNLADGIDHNMELYDVDMPADKVAFDPYSKDYLLD